MNKGIQVISVCTFLLSPLVVMAEQTCFDVSSVPSTTPTERFIKNVDGTVTDTETGLMWQTCEFGQDYDSDSESCTSTALQVDWQQALVAAKNNVYAGFNDWHVPNVKELASIIEHRCVEPAINQTIFTSTQNDNYWTSTTGGSQIDHAWAYQLADGKNNLKAKTSDVFLRLVRYAK
ncbi:hypothetical protein PSECIP111951_01964 [Pseudoalteromonas holothuriae]|uniref:Lcl C-terminal domain-containing protein n=1 Tax=Pseudoalteromonas holothuriae TaxID=2963714 RepID=A0ABN8UL30_9GAMM|nr:DUF1566 domain-containing protein [Pseudoalteromonas sp. CIP111951]CAH9058897.1 hypothetical protein PSECIP111951_01964 [Pseudoalteromonas sp. CIP111951]